MQLKKAFLGSTAIGRVYRGATEVIGPPSPTGGIVFGEFTLSGAGATAISEDDGTYGQFTVSSGQISPNTSPLTVGTVTIGTTDVVVVAGEASVKSQAEFIAAAAQGNLTCRVRAETYPAWTLNNLSLTAVTLAQETGAQFLSIRGANTNNLTLDGLTVVNNNPTSLAPNVIANSAIYFSGGGMTVAVKNCIVDCEADGPSNSLAGIGCRDVTPTIEGNEVRNARFGVYLYETAGVAVVRNNFVNKFYEDAFRAAGSNADFDDNRATLPFAVFSRRLIDAVISGTINVGDEVWNGDKTDIATRGGVVVNVGADFVDLDSNVVQFPLASTTLTGPNGSFTFGGTSVAYDGVHPDFIQTFNFNVSDNLTIRARRNHFYKSTPFVPGVIDQETIAQGIFITDNPASDYENIVIENNVIAVTMGQGITINGVIGGYIGQNTLIRAAYLASNAVPTLRVLNSTDITVGANSAPAFDLATGNTGLVNVDNVTLARSAYDTEMPSLPAAAPFGPIANFAPVAGGVLDAAGAGAVQVNGELRGTYTPAPPPPPSDETVVDFSVTPTLHGGGTVTAVTDGWTWTPSVSGTKTVHWLLGPEYFDVPETQFDFEFTIVTSDVTDDIQAVVAIEPWMTSIRGLSQVLSLTAGVPQTFKLTVDKNLQAERVGFRIGSNTTAATITVTNLSMIPK